MGAGCISSFPRKREPRTFSRQLDARFRGHDVNQSARVDYKLATSVAWSALSLAASPQDFIHSYTWSKRFGSYST